MSGIKDHLTTGRLAHDVTDRSFRCSGACTYGYAVSIDSDGRVLNAATGALHLVIGVACQSGATGDIITVRTKGYCDFVVTNGAAAASGATGDYVLMAVDGGVTQGQTEGEITADVTLSGNIIGKNLGEDSGTAGFCLVGWGSMGYGNDT